MSELTARQKALKEKNLAFLRGELNDTIEIKEHSWLFDKLIGDPLNYGRIGDWQDIEEASALGFLEDNEDASKYHELAMYDALKNHPLTNKNRFLGGILGLASAPAQIAYDTSQDQSPWSQLANRSKGAFKYMMSPTIEKMRLESEIEKAKKDVHKYNIRKRFKKGGIASL